MALMMIDACVHVHFWILFELAKYIFIYIYIYFFFLWESEFILKCGKNCGNSIELSEN